jgi:hypothetical protein
MLNKNLRFSRIFLAFLLVLMLPGFQAFSKLPEVKVRFANPVYDKATLSYLVDVEFQSDQPGLEVFGMNVRFMYDNAALKFASLKNFQGNYKTMSAPLVRTGSAASGSVFGFKGPMDFVNGVVQLKSQTNPIRLTTTGWTKLFSASFIVVDPANFTVDNCCPSLIWDLENDPANGGYMPGDDGVVITAVDPSPKMDSSPVDEVVINLTLKGESGGPHVLFLTDEFGMKVWPNPTPGPVNIDLDWKGIKAMEVVVYNVLGAEVYRKEYMAGERIKFDMSQNVSGQYMMEMNVGEARFIHKLVLDRK